MAGGPRVFVHRSADPTAPAFAIHDLDTGTVTERDEVWLAAAVFRVSEAARYQSLREHRRKIHAGVFGTLLETPPAGPRCDVPVRYQVTESPYFLNDEYRPVHKAVLAHFVAGKVYVPREPRWL
jgi:hypothetical protein